MGRDAVDPDGLHGVKHPPAEAGVSLDETPGFAVWKCGPPGFRGRVMPHLSAEKRQAILESASKLFAAKSFDKVRMEDVAQDAGIGKVTIYRYFPTKEDLYSRLLEQ